MLKNCSLILCGLFFYANSFCMEIAPKSASTEDKKITTTINGTLALIPKEIILESLKILFKDAASGKELSQAIKISEVNKFFRDLFNEDSQTLKLLWKIADTKLGEFKFKTYQANHKKFETQTLDDKKLSKKAILGSLKELSKAASDLLVNKAGRDASKETLLYALDNGANVNEKNKFNGKTPLIKSSGGGQDIVSMLINHGADVNLKDINNQTALMVAASNQKKEIVAILIKHKADPNARNITHMTALMMAAENEPEEIVTILIEAGAKIDEKDKFGNTAMTRAVKRNQMRIAELLIMHGAKLDDENSVNLSANDIQALHEIAMHHGIILFKGAKIMATLIENRMFKK